jgi:hypothetical protein
MEWVNSPQAEVRINHEDSLKSVSRYATSKENYKQNGRKRMTLELWLFSLTIPIVTTSIAVIIVDRINKNA